MAKKFVDALVETEKTAYTLGDGAALTLTNDVRILYNDTIESGELFTIITRIRDAILAGEVPDA